MGGTLIAGVGLLSKTNLYAESNTDNSTVDRSAHWIPIHARRPRRKTDPGKLQR